MRLRRVIQISISLSWAIPVTFTAFVSSFLDTFKISLIVNIIGWLYIVWVTLVCYFNFLLCIYGCVHTWCPSTGAWAPAQNSAAFRHWLLQVPKYHLAPECKVETLYPGTGTVSWFWCEYLEERCAHISAQRESNSGTLLGTKCEHSPCFVLFAIMPDLPKP